MHSGIARYEHGMLTSIDLIVFSFRIDFNRIVYSVKRKYRRVVKNNPFSKEQQNTYLLEGKCNLHRISREGLCDRSVRSSYYTYYRTLISI